MSGPSATNGKSTKSGKAASTGETSEDSKAGRIERLRAFQSWEMQISRRIAEEKQKTLKYPLFKIGNTGRWMYVVCSDNSEVPFSRSQMNSHRAAEEWVNEGGECPFDLSAFV